MIRHITLSPTGKLHVCTENVGTGAITVTVIREPSPAVLDAMQAVCDAVTADHIPSNL